MKVEPPAFQMSWAVGYEAKKRTTSNFLSSFQLLMLFPSTEMVRIVGEEGLGSKIRSLVRGTLSLYCPLDIQISMLSGNFQWCGRGESESVPAGEWIGGEKMEVER